MLTNLNCLAESLINQNRFHEAIVILKNAIKLFPNISWLHNNLAYIFQKLNSFEKAAKHYRMALKLDPKNPTIRLSLAYCYSRLSCFSKAIDQYKRLLIDHPFNFQIYNDLGKTYHQQGNIRNAIANYSKAIELNPSCAYAHFNRGCAWLLTQEWDRGWAEYEWRLKLLELLKIKIGRSTAPTWQGEILKEELLFVFCEQGLGDALQFIRYLKELNKRVKKVLFQPPGPLTKLFEENLLDVDLIDSGLDPSTIKCDYQISLFSLPYVLKNIPSKSENAKPYLFANSKQIENYKKYFANQSTYKIGIVWQGNPDFISDNERCMTLSQFYILGNIPGIQLYSLQKGFGEEQLIQIPEDFSLTPMGYLLNDFADTAAVINYLDLVITVDTATAHLSGALGKEVWVLLPYIPDWRWGLNSTRTFWYPTAHLFRQGKEKDWSTVMQKVAEELRLRINK